MKKDNLTVKKGKHEPILVNEMTFVSPNRNSADIGKLKSAIERAESVTIPNRVALYDIYNHITTVDGHLSGLIEKRVAAVQNKSLNYNDRKGRKIDAFDDLIGSAKFNNLIKLVIESKLWGISGVEFIVGADFDFVEIPRKHIRPENGTIVKSQFQNEGTPIDALPFVFTVGNKKDLGKLLTCSMYSLYKLGGFSDFAQYVEIFGQPVRIVYYDAYDTKTKEQLRQLLNSSGGSLAMMIPQQAKFEMLDGKTSNANGDLQIKFIKACNDEMSIAILGNTETTTSSNSSGYAQAKIQQEGQKEILESDLKFVQSVLNSPHFERILASYGYPVSKGGNFEFERETDLEQVKKTVEVAQMISQQVPVSDDYWYGLGIVPKPDNYEELKAERAASAGSGSARPDEETEEDKTTKGKNLFAGLYDFFVHAPQNTRGSAADSNGW